MTIEGFVKSRHSGEPRIEVRGRLRSSYILQPIEKTGFRLQFIPAQGAGAGMTRNGVFDFLRDHQYSIVNIQ